MSTPLITALDNQDVQTTLFHIQNRTGLEDRDCHGNTPLHLVVLYGFRRALRSLLELNDSRVDLLSVNYQGETPLHIAARRGSTDVAAFLIKYGGMNHKKNVFGDTPALVAILHHNHEIVILIHQASIEWNPER